MYPPIVWMIAFCTIFSSLSLEAMFKVALPADPPCKSFASDSTLRRRCFNRVLKTSSTVGPANGSGVSDTLPSTAPSHPTLIFLHRDFCICSKYLEIIIYVLNYTLKFENNHVNPKFKRDHRTLKNVSNTSRVFHTLLYPLKKNIPK